MNKTKQLIENLKKEIEELENNWSKHKEMHNEGGIIYFERLKAQLQFAEKLIKAIKEDVEKYLKRENVTKWIVKNMNPEELHNMHLGVLKNINKILDEVLKLK